MKNKQTAPSNGEACILWHIHVREMVKDDSTEKIIEMLHDMEWRIILH